MTTLPHRLLALAAASYPAPVTQARALAEVYGLPALSSLDKSGRHFTGSKTPRYLSARASLSRVLRRMEQRGEVTCGRDRRGSWYALPTESEVSADPMEPPSAAVKER